jgi:hypothetical protein
MKLKQLFSVVLIFLTISACSANKSALIEYEENYKPASAGLFRTIVQQDSIFFNAYNNCDLQKQKEYYSDNIEFFHDQGGLMTSKNDLLDATEKNICGKVTRILVENSIEVYPINGYGAVEIGLHKFKNKLENNGNPSYPSKFIIIWHQVDKKWEIAKVVSLH